MTPIGYTKNFIHFFFISYWARALDWRTETFFCQLRIFPFQIYFLIMRIVLTKLLEDKERINFLFPSNINMLPVYIDMLCLLTRAAAAEWC